MRFNQIGIEMVRIKKIANFCLSVVTAKGRSPAYRTVAFGAVIVTIFFITSVVILIILNTTDSTGKYRDIAVVFAATIAATGAITASFIAFQAGPHLEVKKDLHERQRHIDKERVNTEANIITLHIVANMIDGLYVSVRASNDNVKLAIDNANYSHFNKAVESMPIFPDPFPLINEIDVKFMRFEEFNAIRNIQGKLRLLEVAIEQLKTTCKMPQDIQKQIRESLGDDAFWGALRSYTDRVENCCLDLFNSIVPYINQRRAAVIPDEGKLSMLLGNHKNEAAIIMEVVSLDDAYDRIRQLASQLLLEHVHAEDVRTILCTVAKTIKDEDSIPCTDN